MIQDWQAAKSLGTGLHAPFTAAASTPFKKITDIDTRQYVHHSVPTSATLTSYSYPMTYLDSSAL